MKTDSFFSIRFRILLLIIIVILPFLALTFYTAAEQRNQAAAQAKSEAIHLLRNASGMQEELINDSHRFLEVLAQVPAVRDGDPAASKALFTDLVNLHPIYANIGLIKPDGAMLSCVFEPSGKINIAERAYFQRALTTRNFAIGDYQIGCATGKPSLNFGYPILDGSGEVKLVLFAALDLNWVSRLASESELPDGANLTLIDRNGTVLASYRDPENLVGKTVSESPFFQSVQSHRGEGAIWASGIDGKRSLVVFRPLNKSKEGGDVYIYADIPAYAIFAGANHILARNIVWLGLVTALVLAIAWAGGSLFFHRRVNTILGATQKLAEGDLGARTGLPYSRDELGLLAMAFDKMAVVLEQRTRQALKAEAEYQLILGSAGEGIFGLDLSGRIIFANPAAARMLGYETDEIVFGNSHSLCHHTKTNGSHYPEEECPIYAAYKDGLVHHVSDEVFWRKDGTSFPVEYISTPARENGELVGAVVVFKDITDRKLAEEALRESEEKYRAIFEAAVAGTVIIEQDATISLANPVMEKITGYTREEVEGKKSWTEFVFGEDIERLRDLRSAADASSPVSYEFKTADRNTNIKDIFMTIARIPGTSKSVASFMDITERKRAEERVRREAARVELLAEVSQELTNAGVKYQSVLSAVARRVARLFGDSCVIMLHSEDGQHVEPVAFHHKKEATGLMGDIVSETNNVIEGLKDSLEAGRPLLIPDLQHGIQGVLIVPMHMQGRVIGILALYRESPGNPYNDDDLAFLQDLVERVTLAINNTHLYRENLRQLESLRALYDSALKLGQNLNLKVLSEGITRTCVEVFSTSLAWLSLAEEDGSVSLLSHYPQENDFPRRASVRWDNSPLGNGAIGRSIRSASPVIITDISADPGYAPWRESVLEQGFCCAAAFPLIIRNTPLGALLLYSDRTGFFVPERVEFFQAYVQLAAAALENARLFEKAERRINQVQALRSIDMAITGSLDLRVTFNIVIDQVIRQLGVDAADILMLNQYSQTLEYAAGRGFRSKDIERSRIRLGEGYAGRAVYERRMIVIKNLPEAGASFLRAPLLAGEDFIAYFGVPLIAKGQIKGILEIYHREPLEPDPEWKDFLETLAGQAAIAIDNAAMFNDLQRSNIELTLAYDSTIEGLSYALDLRDKETEGHSRRVTETTVRLARAMGLGEAELVHVRRGALLHDIGKLGVPDQILLKPGPLTGGEWEIMYRHPVYAYEMLSPIAHLRPALDIPYCHHEKWDGTGYPRGLKGEQIPLPARIFALVDVWDALLSHRPYRPAWPEEKVLKHIAEQSGKHFDPKVVEVFLSIEERGEQSLQ